MENPPNPSLYVRNLNEKVNKDELRRSLYYLFSQFGAILDVVALKTQRMRGQAFVVFRDITSATSAMRSLENFNFYDKPMRLAYSKTRSEAHYRFHGETPGAPSESKKKAQKRKAAADDGSKPAKRAAKHGDGPAAAPSSARPAASSTSKDNGKPNKILFCTNLPDETSEAMLGMLFQQFPGYKEVRLVEGRHDIAFIEFESDAASATARDALQGFKISPSHQMKIEFAKK